MRDARNVLAEAQTALVHKEGELDALRQTRERARVFAGEIAHEFEELVGHDIDAAASHAEMVKDALSRGAVPLFDEAPALTANAQKRAHVERKLAAARLAYEQLQGEEREAEAGVTKARDEVRLATTLLLADEANEIAEEIERLERDAFMLRARLGGPLGVVGQLRAGHSAAVQRVMAGNDKLDAVMLTPAGRSLSIEATRARRVWQAFAEALEADCDAALKFDLPDDAVSSRAA